MSLRRKSGLPVAALNRQPNSANAVGNNRRQFLLNAGLGFGSLALSTMLERDVLGAAQTSGSHFAPRAKNVIWLFMIGGASHLESFDPKPDLAKYAGKSIQETPHKEVLNSPFLENKRDLFEKTKRPNRTTIFPTQIGFRKRGQSGLDVSNWWPNVGDCADDLSVVRSVWTEDIDHGAQLQFHTGRHRNDGFFPTIGSWASYGLGSLNDNLPEFVVLGGPTRPDTVESIHPYYLGAKYAGVPLKLDANDPLPYGRRRTDVLANEQKNECELIGRRGGRRFVLVCGAPLVDDRGNLAATIGTFADITARKEAEREIREAREIGRAHV